MEPQIKQLLIATTGSDLQTSPMAKWLQLADFNNLTWVKVDMTNLWCK